MPYWCFLMKVYFHYLLKVSASNMDGRSILKLNGTQVSTSIHIFKLLKIPARNHSLQYSTNRKSWFIYIDVETIEKERYHWVSVYEGDLKKTLLVYILGRPFNCFFRNFLLSTPSLSVCLTVRLLIASSLSSQGRRLFSDISIIQCISLLNISSSTLTFLLYFWLSDLMT